MPTCYSGLDAVNWYYRTNQQQIRPPVHGGTMEQFIEMAFKYGTSLIFNIWFMFRIEGVLKDVVSTNSAVVSHLRKEGE